MAEWLGRASQGYEMYCHNLEVMGSNPVGWNSGCIVFLSKSYLNQNISCQCISLTESPDSFS